WKDIELLQKAGHEIGSHTMSHMNVAQASETEIREDMQASLEVLTKYTGDVKHFAFPYGRVFHFSEIGRKACFDAGFVSCASAERGCHIQGNEKTDIENVCIRRDHVIIDWPYLHIEYFLVENSKRAELKNNLFP